MAEEKKHTFVVSAQTLNGLGCIILTSGIDTESFIKNPIMCLNHNTNCVLGRWENLRVDGTELLADAVFDTEDEGDGKLYSGKVDRGFIKGCSVWLEPEDIIFGHELFPNDIVVTKSTLREISIAPVPENSSALKLSKQGKLLTKDDVLKLSSDSKSQINIPMNKLLLAACAALGLDVNSNEDQVIVKLQSMKNDNEELTRLRTEVEEYKRKDSEMKLSRVNDMVDGAITAKKIMPAQKETYVKLATSDYESTKKILDEIKPHVTLSSQMKGEGAAASQFEGKDFKWLQKNAPKELIRLKAEEPEKFIELFNAADWKK